MIKTSFLFSSFHKTFLHSLRYLSRAFVLEQNDPKFKLGKIVATFHKTQFSCPWKQDSLSPFHNRAKNQIQFEEK